MTTDNHLQHVAFILDGNRRWAKARGKMAVFGHRAGAETVEKIALHCQAIGVRYATFWALSTENLRERSSTELRGLYTIIGALHRHFDRILKHDIRINIIGNLTALPQKQRSILADLCERTREGKSLTMTLAINYGGRDELLRAFKKIIQEEIANAPFGKGGQRGLNEAGKHLTEERITQALDTYPLPDPDLIVRTGGKKRLSGYLPWQSIYSELYFTDVLWPDFDAEELDRAITYFHSVQRNFGH